MGVNTGEDPWPLQLLQLEKENLLSEKLSKDTPGLGTSDTAEGGVRHGAGSSEIRERLHTER